MVTWIRARKISFVALFGVFLLFFFSIPVSAASTVYDGSVSFSSKYCPVYLQSTGVVQNSANNVIYKSQSMHGSGSNILTLNDIEPGTVLNGSLVLSGTATANYSQTYFQIYSSQVAFESSLSDGITVSSYAGPYNGNSVSFSIKITFSNYHCSNSYVDIPLSFDLFCAVYYSGLTDPIFSQLQYDFSFSSTYTGVLNLVPYAESDLVNNPLFEKVEEIEGNQQSVIDDAASAFQDTESKVATSISDYQEQESILVSDSVGRLESFDFNTGSIDTMGSGVLAAFWWIQQNLHNIFILTEYSSVLHVVAVVSLAAILLGARRLWRS